MIVFLVIASAFLAVALLGSCVYCLAVRNKTKKGENHISSEEIQLHDISGPSINEFLHQTLQGRDNLTLQEFPFINLATLNAATDNFSDSNKLGEGGFGSVFKVKGFF